MSANKVNKIFNPVTIVDPEKEKFYIFQDNKIEPSKLTSLKKDNFYISTISIKNVITSTVEISKSISDVDLGGAISVQVYDELNLDPSFDYLIKYSELVDFKDDNKRKFNIFVVEKEKLAKIFGETLDKIKYIDYIALESLLFKSIYTRKVLDSGYVDCFLYIRKSDAFLTIYSNGNYIYSKSLSFSLDYMQEKFCGFIGKNYKYNDFISYLLNDSIDEHSEYLDKIYEEMFSNIKDITLYVKRAFLIEDIDRIYVNSNVGKINGIDAYIKKYTHIETLEFTLFESSQKVEQLYDFVALEALEYIKNPKIDINFSIFKRPPPFYKRMSGKMILITTFSIFLLLLYPLYQFIIVYNMKMNTISIQENEHKLSKEVLIFQKEFLKLSKKKKSLRKKLDKELKKLNFRKELLRQIYNKKVNYQIKTNLLVDIIKKIVKYNLKLYSINLYSGKKITIKLSVVGYKSRDITKFIRALSSIKKYSVATKEIKKDDKKDIYLSDIEVIIDENI